MRKTSWDHGFVVVVVVVDDDDDRLGVGGWMMKVAVGGGD